MTENEEREIIEATIQLRNLICDLNEDLQKHAEMIPLLPPYKTSVGCGCRLTLSSRNAWYEIELLRVGTTNAYGLRCYRKPYGGRSELVFEGIDSIESFESLRARIFDAEEIEITVKKPQRVEAETKPEELVAV